MTSADRPSLDLYRPNVGMVLARVDGKVWLGRRAGTPGPHNWQFPQGGVDKGEALLAAALRELHEETGVRTVTLLDRTQDWMAYEFPQGYRRSRPTQGWVGQKQIWFLFRFDGEDSEIDIAAHAPPEFDLWRWAPPKEALAGIVGFKQASYQRVLDLFGPRIQALSDGRMP